MTRSCPHCGTLNRDSAIFCNQCGALLTASANAPGSNVGTVVRRVGDDPNATIITAAAQDPRATIPQIPVVAGASGTTRPTPGTGLLPPDTLINDRYLVVEKLGQGGMAAVYKVKDMEKRGGLRAIKEMSQAPLRDNEREQAILNFHAEAELLRSLDHPNLPKFYEQFEQEDRYYLVMEYVDGETLEDRLDRVGKGLPEADVLGWAEQLCSVLSYLHGRKPPIIFRDLKPGNIMLTKQGQVKLIDFGIARIFRSDKTHDTQVLGTPGYAPPEQYGKSQTTQRSDVYALGVTLHQLLTNYDPSSTPFSLPPINSLNPNVSPHVQVAIEKATRLRQDERYESVAEFSVALFAPGGFIFRDGQRATTVAELVALSRTLPKEAEEHLYAGRYEKWLGQIGEKKLAKAAKAIPASQSYRPQGLVEFLAEADRSLGVNVSKRPAGAPTGATIANGAALQVQPGLLDIGGVTAGQSGVASFTVGGAGGARVNGEIKPLVSWLRVEPSRFNGASTLVSVRADTGWLPGGQRQQGSIQITSGGQRVIMPVTIDVQGNVPAPLSGPQGRKLKHYLKYTAPPLRQPEIIKQALSAALAFGLPLTALLVTQSVITFPTLTNLLSGPFFPLLVLAATLLTTVGALLGRWGTTLHSRLLTSAVCTLSLVGLVALGWTQWLQPSFFGGTLHPEALLLATFIVGALAAALGAAPRVSGGLLRFLAWLARRATRLVFLLLLGLGGYVGYVLTSGFAPAIFRPIGIGGGILIGALFAAWVNLYVRRGRRQQPGQP